MGQTIRRKGEINEKEITYACINVDDVICCCCGVEQYTDEQGNTRDLIGGRFVVLNECTDNGDVNSNYRCTYITYDKDTKVMYYILDGYHRTGLCPMYDINGDVMVYGGEKDGSD